MGPNRIGSDPFFFHGVGEDPQRHTFQRFGKHLVEGGEICLLLEDPQPPIGPIEHMVRIPTHNRPSTTRHDDDHTTTAPPRQEMIPVPFISALYFSPLFQPL
jgi:hypothetical protein